MRSPTPHVHVIPMGLDYDRIVRGLESYGYSKIYLLRGHPHPIEDAVQPYVDKLRRHYRNLVSAGRFKEIRLNIFDIGEVCSAIYNIMNEEKEAKLHFAISSSTKLLCSYMLFAAWSKGEEMKHTPVIYYVDPQRYVHIEFTQLASTASDLIEHFDGFVNEGKLDRIREFVQQIRDLSVDAQRGMAIGEANERPIHEIPFIPVKRPGRIGLTILKLLHENKSSFRNIDQLTKHYLRLTRGIKEKDVGDALLNRTRSMLHQHINKLKELRMIETERVGRNVRIRSTELGEVFGKAFSG